MAQYFFVLLLVLWIRREQVDGAVLFFLLVFGGRHYDRGARLLRVATLILQPVSACVFIYVKKMGYMTFNTFK